MRGKVCRKPYERQPCPGRLNAKKGRRTGPITDHGDLTVKNPKSVDGKVADKNVFPPEQGYLPKFVTKINEMPATFESSVVK